MKQGVAKPERPKKSGIKAEQRIKIQRMIPSCRNWSQETWIWEKNKTLSMEAGIQVSQKGYPKMFAKESW